MAKSKLTINDVTKKYLKTAAYLFISWGLALVLAGVSKNSNLIGLAPLINYIGYVLEKELYKDEGFRKILRK